MSTPRTLTAASLSGNRGREESGRCRVDGLPLSTRLRVSPCGSSRTTRMARRGTRTMSSTAQKKIGTGIKVLDVKGTKNTSDSATLIARRSLQRVSQERKSPPNLVGAGRQSKGRRGAERRRATAVATTAALGRRCRLRCSSSLLDLLWPMVPWRRLRSRSPPRALLEYHRARLPPMALLPCR